MLGLLRNIVIVFLLLTVIYVLLSVTARWRERARLTAEYKTQSALRQQTMEKDVFIAQGMKRYGRSYKPKLILGVYIVPGAIIGFLIYLAQYT